MSWLNSFGPSGAVRHSIVERCWHSLSRRRPALAVLAALAPAVSWGCACGCGVFDVGTGSMFPQGTGGMLFTEYDYMDQNKNWSGTSQAPAANNSDKRIETDFFTLGGQYMLDRSWGIVVEIPYWNRSFTTTADSGDVVTFKHDALGDVRLKGIYTGFSPDLSSGITFGVKLPTGDSTYANFDPDTEISTGSTDVLLGAYHLGRISLDGEWNYFLQAQWDEPVRSKATYRPGSEIVAVAGAYYSGFPIGSTAKIAPVAQVIAAYRGHDGGLLGDPVDSGYTRAFVAPGIELDVGKVRVYFDVAFTVYNNMSGNQLVASRFYKLNLSYDF